MPQFAFRRALLKSLAVALAFSAAVSLPRPASAEYPDRLIKIIVGLPAGSPNDVLARLVGDRLSRRIGQNVIVENRPGAAGITATQTFVHEAPPDGYNLIVGSVTLGTAYAIRKNRPNFDIVEDLTPLAMITSSPMVIVVPSALPPKTLAEFIAYAKAKPGDLNFASVGGIGGAVHLNAVLFLKQTGLDLVHVPYPGSPAVIPALMTNQVQLFVVDNSSVTSAVQAGNLRALAIAAPQRLETLPDVPTTKELGVPFEAAAWYGLFAPKGLPGDIRKTLQDQLAAILKDPAFKADLAARGGFAGDLFGEDFRKFLSADVAKWQKIVADANIDPQ